MHYWNLGRAATGCGTWPRRVCNVVNAIVLLATLDHYDLQKLMIEEQAWFESVLDSFSIHFQLSTSSE